MSLFKGKYRNQTVRLRTWDYAASAYYYLTICTRERAHFFGGIVDGAMVLSDTGQVAQQYWVEIPQLCWLPQLVRAQKPGAWVILTGIDSALNRREWQ